MKIKVKELEKLVIKALRKKYSSEDSKQIAEVIMFGELSGKKSHGIVRLIKGGSSMLAQNPQIAPQLIKKKSISLLIESNENPGMLIGQLATDEALKRAKKYGIGIVATRGTLSTSGCVSYYAEKIAKKGFISIIMSHSPLCIAPFNSVEPLLGTNPITFGFPTSADPFIFDMGTSVVSFGHLLKADANGQKLEPEVALDINGNPTTDPAKAIDGALLPFDRSYKGSGLAMIVELFGGVWPNANFVGLNEEGGWGSIYMVYDPELLTGRKEFQKRVTEMLERIRNSKTSDGKKVRIPGETTLKTRNEAIKSGIVEVDDVLIDMVNTYIKEY